MVKFTVINTFKNIAFDNQKKPLVICDIDHTFIRPKYDYDYYYNKLKPEYADTNELNEMVSDMYEMAMTVGFIKQTDKEGFTYMIEQINNFGGKLIFLTARGGASHNKTVRDLVNVGLYNAEDYEIHYTGNQITKGDYIKKNNLLDGYEHFTFIDDYPSYIDSVIKVYPEINCYLFKYQ